MQRVYFDSSFLMAVVVHPTTWFEDMVDGMGKFDPVLLGCVEDELTRLAEGQGGQARWARVALEMAARFSRQQCGGADVDAEIVSAGASSNGWVASMDKELIGSLRASHVRVVSLSGGRVVLE